MWYHQNCIRSGKSSKCTLYLRCVEVQRNLFYIFKLNKVVNMLWVPSLHHKNHVTLFIFTKRTKRQKLYFHSLGYFSVHFWSEFVTFFLCILHKFAFSQIIQDGLELQILGTICYLLPVTYSISLFDYLIFPTCQSRFISPSPFLSIWRNY